MNIILDITRRDSSGWYLINYWWKISFGKLCPLTNFPWLLKLGTPLARWCEKTFGICLNQSESELLDGTSHMMWTDATLGEILGNEMFVKKKKRKGLTSTPKKKRHKWAPMNCIIFFWLFLADTPSHLFFFYTFKHSLDIKNWIIRFSLKKFRSTTQFTTPYKVLEAP